MPALTMLIMIMHIAYHHLETIRRETIERKTGETMERRTSTGRYHLAEASARQADVETAS